VIFLQVQPEGAKQVRIAGIDPVLLDSLYALPEILEQRDKPAARERLLPAPTAAEPAINEEWQQLVAPELRHLFVSAGEIVARDLTGLSPDPRGEPLQQVVIPLEHLNAWLSALNQARLILGALHEVTEADMTNEEFDLENARSLAIFRIHVLGYLLQALVKLSDDHEAGV
jgi:hypothetical protein